MQSFRLFPDQASSLAPRVDSLYFFLIGVSAFFSLLIVVFLVFFAIRYRRRPGHEAAEVRSSFKLEVVWTAIPTVFAMIMFFWGGTLFLSETIPPVGAREINVVGQQWMWKIQHSNGRREINELHVPANQPVKLTLTSQDTIHSFYVPAFRVKQDAIPGQYRTLWFEATLPGEYHLFCAEYCGTNHSRMIGRVVVLTDVEYEDWLESGSGQTPVEAGKQLFSELDCASCHQSGARQRAPGLGGLFGTTVALESGRTVVFDESYIRESVFDPGAKVVKGFPPAMPTYQGQISEEQLLDLIAYIKALSGEAQGEPVEGGAR